MSGAPDPLPPLHRTAVSQHIRLSDPSLSQIEHPLKMRPYRFFVSSQSGRRLNQREKELGSAFAVGRVYIRFGARLFLGTT